MAFNPTPLKKKAAHIMLLESLPFIRHFISMNRDYFE